MRLRRSLLALTAALAVALLGVTSVLASDPARAAAHAGRDCPAAARADQLGARSHQLGRCGPIACALSSVRRNIHPRCGCPLAPVRPPGARPGARPAICACPVPGFRANLAIRCICPPALSNAPSIGACPGSVSVNGAVTTPATYSYAQLAAMPQTMFTLSSTGTGTGTGTGTRAGGAVTATGVPLESLVAAAQPTVDPTIKNGLLRVTVSVAARFAAPITFAEGELDPSFGNHPAYLALTVGGHKLPAPTLFVPGDDQPIREIPAVSTITVGVQSPAPTAGFTPGTLTVEQGMRTTTLSAAQLAALPPETVQASFLAGTTTTNVTEIGPSLDEVLRAAHVPLGLGTWVAGVGDDGYITVVTPAEQWVGGKYLQISLNENGSALAEPRLVVDGDVKGGRYVSGLVDLVVGQGAPPRLVGPIPQRPR